MPPGRDETVQKGHGPEQGVYGPVETVEKRVPPPPPLVGGRDLPGSVPGSSPLVEVKEDVEDRLHRLGEESRVGALEENLEPGVLGEGSQLLQGVALSDMAVNLRSETKEPAQAWEEAPPAPGSREVGPPRGLEDSGQFGHQEPVVDRVLQKVEAEDDVEAVVRKGKALADQDDPVAEDLAGLT